MVLAAIVLVLPAIIALIAENTGHVKAVGAMTKRDLDPMIGRAIFADLRTPGLGERMVGVVDRGRGIDGCYRSRSADRLTSYSWCSMPVVMRDAVF